MLLEVIDENGTKKFRQLSGTTSDGIPLGSYVSVEGNAVPDGFLECDGSTFDADAYPALAMLLGSNTLPERFDHSRLSDYENITLSTNSNNPTVMDYDGFLSRYQDSVNHDIWIYVNGVITRDYVGGGDGSAGTILIPVNAGDRVYSNALASSARARYYKKHMLIKAVPGHVEDTTGLFNQIKDYSGLYSTEERVCGTWIDGKPIYRKVIPFIRNSAFTSTWTSLGSNQYQNTTDMPVDVDTYCPGTCAVSTRTDGWCDVYGSTLNTSIGFVPNVTGQKIWANFITVSAKSDIVLLYTKTTD